MTTAICADENGVACAWCRAAEDRKKAEQARAVRHEYEQTVGRIAAVLSVEPTLAAVEEEIERLQESVAELTGQRDHWRKAAEGFRKRYEPYNCKHCGGSTRNPKEECVPCAIL